MKNMEIKQLNLPKFNIKNCHSIRKSANFNSHLISSEIFPLNQYNRPHSHKFTYETIKTQLNGSNSTNIESWKTFNYHKQENLTTEKWKHNNNHK